MQAQPQETVGGQAVLEGVMMRSPGRLAIAVRSPEGSIVLDEKPFVSLSKRSVLFGLPVLRGAVALLESLAVGIKALNFSAEVAEGRLRQDGQGGRFSKPSSPREKWGLLLTLLTSFVLAMALFQYLPYWLAGFAVGGRPDAPSHPFLFNLAAGGVRVTLLLGYMVLISRMKEIRRLFQYHGAEHKSIFAFEKGRALEVEEARGQTRFHPRCGTSFLLIVALTCVLVFSIFDALLLRVLPGAYPTALHRFLIHLPLVPLVAGIAFEVLKGTARFQESLWVKPFIAPGLWLQKITTREPDADQLEVALASIRAALKP